MHRRRLIGLAAIAAGLGVVVCAGPQEAVAQGKTNPFVWGQYTGKDGKQYNYPQWNDKGGGQRTLSLAQGQLSHPQNPPVTKVVMKVYPQGSQSGTYSTTPNIVYELNPVPTYQAFPISGYILVGRDNDIPAEVFNEGDTVKFSWEVTTTLNGVATTDVIDMPVTVNFH